MRHSRLLSTIPAVIVCLSLVAGIGCGDTKSVKHDSLEPSLQITSPEDGAQVTASVIVPPDFNEQEDQLPPAFVHVSVKAEQMPQGAPIKLAIEQSDDPILTSLLDDDGVADFLEVPVSKGTVTVVASAAMGPSTDPVTASATFQVVIEIVREIPPSHEPALTFIEPADGSTFTSKDDMDGNLRNGFQTDVILKAENIASGTLVHLQLDGMEVATGPVVAVTETEGQVLFESVELPETGGTPLVLSAHGADLVVEAEVVVETGRCLVRLWPSTSGECDFGPADDTNPGTGGVTRFFRVDSSCSDITMFVNGQTVAQGKTNSQGQVIFNDITIPDGTGTIQAKGENPGDGRYGQSLSYPYESISIPPTITFDHLSTDILNPTVFTSMDDIMVNKPGLQIRVSGVITGMAEGVEPVARLRMDQVLVEEPVVSLTPAGSAAGRWLFQIDALTFPDPGMYTLEVTASDRCGNEALGGMIGLVADTGQPVLEIISPLDNAILTPSGDMLADEDYLQTVFQVNVAGIPPNGQVFVECRPTESDVWLDVNTGTVTVPAGGSARLDVEVFLRTGAQHCRAAYRGANAAVSNGITIVVASGEPSIWFTDVDDGQYVTSSAIDVILATANVEDGRQVTLLVNGALVALGNGGLVVDGGVVIPQVPLQSGLNTLEAGVSDGLGQQAQPAIISVILDNTPPVVVIEDPQDGLLITGEDDGDRDLTNGLQISVHALVEDMAGSANADAGAGAGAGAGELKACLYVDAFMWGCRAVADGAVIFPGVTLSEGPVVLRIEGSDLAGNTGEAISTVTVDTGAVSLRILSPQEGQCLLAPAPAQGLPPSLMAEIMIQSDGEPDSEVFLNVNQQIGGAARVDGDGYATILRKFELGTFAIAAFSPDVSGKVGYSQHVRFQVLDGSTGPDLEVVLPAVDGWLNGEVPDSSGMPGFQTNVKVMGAGINDDSPVTIDVACAGNGTIQHQSVMTGGEVLFKSVTLQEGSCTITARTSDCAGRPAQTVSAFTVDRTPPQVAILSHQTGDIITGQADVRLEQDGIQAPVVVDVKNVAAGAPVRVKAGESPEVSLPVASENSVVTFPEITFRAGRNVPLTAVAVDSAGNQARVQHYVDVLDGLPELQWVIPHGAGCMVDASAAPDFQGNFEFIGVDLDEGVAVRLCSDNVPLPTGNFSAVDCNGKPGFRVVGERFISGGRVAFRDVALVDGGHHIYGEVVVRNQVIAQSSELDVAAVSTQPTVAGVRVLEDVGVLPGVLNKAKDSDANVPGFQGTVEVDVTLSQVHLLGENRATLYSDYPSVGTVLGEGTLGHDGSLLLPVSLPEGNHNLTVIVQDFCDSQSPVSQGFPYVVDVTAPSISFQQPSQGQVLLNMDDENPAVPGLQYTVIAVTDAEQGQVATLTVDPAGSPGGGAVLQSTVAGGAAMFQDVNLGVEGNYTLTLNVSDDAENPSASRQLDVLVDAIPPVISILAPAGDTVLEQDDDADPAAPGFQVALQVAFEGAAPTSLIQVHSNLVGEVCSTSDGAEGVVSLMCTITKGNHQLTAMVEDENGNVGRSLPVSVSLQLPGCGIYFSRPLYGPAHLDENDDKDLNGANGLQYDLAVGIMEPACVGRQVTLFRDGNLVSTVAAAADLTATFPDQSFSHGDDVIMLARIDDGAGVVSQDSRRLTVALLPPSVSFIAPAEGVFALNQGDDLNLSEDGLQYTFRFAVSGPEIGGGSLKLESDRDGVIGETSTVLSGGVMSLQGVTLSENTHRLTVTVSDTSGKSTSLERNLLVDVTPPARPDLEVSLVDRRKPVVELNWIAVGDDGTGGAGGEAVAAYDLRYSDNPIDEGNFESACMVDEDITPGEPGAAQEVVVQGPKGGACRFRIEGTYHFALRATDKAGNHSPGAVSDGGLDIRLKIMPIPTHDIPSMGLTVQGVGDLNGDGFEDMVVGTRHLDQRKVVVMYGAEEPDQMITQIISVDDSIFGYSIAGGFLDLNGDGLSDLVVGSMSTAYVFFGQNGAQLQPTPSVEIILPAGDGGPLQLAAGGNFNGAMNGGSRMDSLLVSSPFFDGRRGGAWIVTGRASWPATMTLSTDAGDNLADDVVRLEPAPGATGPQRFGSEIAVIGDMDGDGMDEVVVGAMEAESIKGRAYVFYGRAIDSVSLLTPDSINVLTLERTGGGQYFGATVAGGFQDLDGDGVPDFGVVSQYTSRLSIYHGGPIDEVEVLHNFDDSTRFFGSPTGFVGDFDGNGLGDVVVSSNYPSPYSNKLWFFFNDVSGFGAADPIYQYGVEGFGSRMAPAGDVNGDGYPDLVVGSNGKGGFLFY